MKLYYDEKVDTLYLRLDESRIVDSEEIKEGIVLDYNQEDQVVGIEILEISKRVPLLELKKVQLDFA